RGVIGGRAGIHRAGHPRALLLDRLVVYEAPAVLLVQIGDRRAWSERIQRLPGVGLAGREHLRGIEVHLYGGETLRRGGGHLLALGAFLRQLYAAFLDGAE